MCLSRGFRAHLQLPPCAIGHAAPRLGRLCELVGLLLQSARLGVQRGLVGVNVGDAVAEIAVNAASQVVEVVVQLLPGFVC